MAPINPVQILDAFTPLLTENGGIKPVDQTQFQKIYDIMKNCSTKLVSKCIYYQILMSTSPDVLEQFLKIGGWDLICLWVKSSRDIGNVTFLLDLLKLLHILPMNIDRLRENECPKIVKKLCKHENEEIALKANQIIKKWTKIIHALSSGEKSSSSNSSSNNVSKEKKRKSLDSSTSSDISNVKKTKYSCDNESDKTTTGNNSTNSDQTNASIETSDLYETYSRDDMNKFMVNPQPTKEANQTMLTTKRPVTAKVKQGKFRLDLSSTSSTTATLKSSDKIKKKNNNSKPDDPKKLLKNENLAKSNLSTKATATPSTTTRNVLKDSMSFMDALSMMPVVGIKKRRKLINNNKDTENKLQTNHKQDKPNVMANTAVATASSVLSVKESSSLVIEQLATKNSVNLTIIENSNNTELMMINNNITDKSGNNSGGVIESNIQSKSPPRFSFYKDILDEKCKENENSVNDNSSQQEIDDNKVSNSEDNNKSYQQSVASENTGNNTMIDSANKAIDREEAYKEVPMDTTMSKCDNLASHGDIPFKPKSILCYIKKNSKKSVRWPDDDSNLEQVKYFELDETERINVTRPSADMKRFDMKHEAQMMSEAKKCFTYAPWKLIPIDLDPTNVPVERGKDSIEKLTQMERMKTTLECFYFHNQIPDNPEDPEMCYEIISDMNEKTKIIPLEDENASIDRVQDYASLNTMAPTMDPNNFANNMSFVPGSGDAINFNNSSDQNYLPFNTTTMTNQQNYNTPGSIPQFQNNNSANYMPPAASNTFDGPNPSTNNNFNVYNNYPNASTTNQQPPVTPFANPNNLSGPGSTNVPYQDFNSNVPPNNYGSSGFNQNNNQSQGSTNYFNNNSGPQMNHIPPPSNESYSNNYWPEPNPNNPVHNSNSNNYPPGGGPSPSYPPISPPPHSLGPPGGGGGGGGPPPGPRFRPRGPGGPRGPRGFHPRNGSDICRFFFKTGKCKFENRCNFSHVIDNHQKPPIRF